MDTFTTTFVKNLQSINTMGKAASTSTPLFIFWGAVITTLAIALMLLIKIANAYIGKSDQETMIEKIREMLPIIVLSIIGIALIWTLESISIDYIDSAYTAIRAKTGINSTNF